MRELRQLGLAGSLALAIACCVSPHAAAQGTITAQCTSRAGTRTCNTGWYTSPVSVVWKATEPMAVAPCQLGIRYEYLTDTVTFLKCNAFWSGEEASFGFTLHVEVSSPTAEALPERSPDSNGWYNHPVAFTFVGRGYSGTASCRASGSSAAVTYNGPDALSATVGATCTDPAGKSVLPSAALHYDSTPPTITGAIPSRPPDFNGWYNHPVTFVFTGTDATAGIESCTSTTYAGPDSAHAEVVGSCKDRAGNTASLAMPLRYQATPPQLDVQAGAVDGSALLHWQSSAEVEIVRSPGSRGRTSSLIYKGSSGSFRDVRVRDGVSYTYTITARDQAGNTTVRTVSIVAAGPRLSAPTSGPRLTAPPLLRWKPVRGASYYNLQLYRGTKILTLWPARARLRLKRAWRFDGRFYRLTPGRYRWYVWPGFGSRGAARYGALIGRGQFVVGP